MDSEAFAGMAGSHHVPTDFGLSFGGIGKIRMVAPATTAPGRRGRHGVSFLALCHRPARLVLVVPFARRVGEAVSEAAASVPRPIPRPRPRPGFNTHPIAPPPRILRSIGQDPAPHTAVGRRSAVIRYSPPYFPRSARLRLLGAVFGYSSGTPAPQSERASAPSRSFV